MCEECDDVKWSWTKFWIGKLSNKFIAFNVFTAIMFITLFVERVEVKEPANWILWITYGVVTIIFMLAGAIDTAVANAKISMELKAAAEMKADGASLIKEVKNKV